MFLPRHCPGCGRPARSICDACLASFIPDISGGPGLFVYDGPLRRILIAAKNHQQPHLYRRLGRLMADELVSTARWAPDDGAPWTVTWVPASLAHARDRGFDHGRHLAQAVGRHLGLRSRRLLRRRRGPSQTGLDRRHRLVGPELEARSRSPRRILVVDDVATTGTSLDRAQRVLEAAGADAVVTAAFGSVQPGRTAHRETDTESLGPGQRRPMAR